MIDIKVPEVGESITEVTIARWLKKDGDWVDMDETIAELDSDKATFELPAEKAGVISIVAEEGADVNVGDVICRIDEKATRPEGAKQDVKKAKQEQETEAKKPAAEAKEEKTEKRLAKASATAVTTDLASPSAAKLMREHDIDQSQINGSGKEGRITKEDVLNVIEKKGEQKEPVQKIAPPSESEKEAVQEVKNKKFIRGTRTEKMSRLRQTIARRLVEVKNQTAMLTTFNDVDMSAIMDIRNKHKDKFKEKYGIGLGFMSFFTKACCIALEQWPAVNASIEGEEIIYHDFFDISIAVSTPRGLVVPVIKNAESLSMAEIEKAVMDLATRARDNKLGLEEMQGGTFTITNGGVFGSLLSTPIINGSQSAILGMHRIEERPVALNGQVVIKPMMYLALSYDHRIIDGRESVSFLKTVKELLESPAALYAQGDPVKMLLGL